MMGRFFIVDKNSNFSQGQVIFRYKIVELCKEQEASDKEKNEIRYPIYLTLNPFAIDFYYHGPDLPNENFSEKIKIKNSENSPENHFCVLHLPLSLNLAAKDNLSSILKDIYFEKIKLNKIYCVDFLHGRDTYWDIEEFPDSKAITRDEHILFLRKLIFDFLYDLEHSSVFEASPLYERIEVRLRENFVFSSISAKAAYCFNRNMYFSDSINSGYKRIYAPNTASSEKQWLNYIRNESAVSLFKEQGWFYEVENEYKRVLFNKKYPRKQWIDTLTKISENYFSEENIKILRESARWYLRRYNFYNGFRAIFQFYENRKALVFLLSIITFFISPLILYSYNKPLIYHNINDIVIAFITYVFLGCVPFVLVVSFILYRMFLPFLSAMLPRLLMAIASSWLLFSATEELIKSSFDVQILDIHKIWVFLLIIPVVAFMAVEINNMAPDIGAKTIVKRMLTLLSIGFIYSLLIGMFFTNSLTQTIFVRSGYLPEFYSSEFSVNDRLYLEIDSTASNFSKDIELAIKSEFLSTLPDKSDKELYQYLSFLKYNIPWLSQDPFRLRYVIPVIRNRFSFEIFPGMLIYRAIFALFVGIFIQLIFEDKPITEPL